jgi:tetratricopeptide (TPR) repeat protein
MEFSQQFSFDALIDLFERYKTVLIITGVVVGLSIGGGVYWYMARTKQQELAQATLSEVLNETIRAQQNAELWPEIEVAARTGYQQYSSTSLAPYFLAVQADALIQQNKNSEALVLMNESLSKLSQSSPLYFLYATKQARVMLDSEDEQVKTQGLEQLISLSKNNNNLQKDETLYYLGSHYLNNGENAKAINAFNEIIELTKNQTDYPSPWTRLAQEAVRELA